MNTTTQPKAVVQLPTVQLIGAPKAGTSAVADWLFDMGGFCRPRVFAGEPWYYSKEVHFFDDDGRFHQGVEFYGERFPEQLVVNGEPAVCSMDATPDTLAFAERVRYAYDVAGGNQADTLRIIAILREPASRELSLYNHLAFDCRNLPIEERTSWHDQVINADGTIMSFDEFVVETSIPALRRDSGPGMSTRHSLYASHLLKWFQLFDRKQILVLSYDELVFRPEALQDRIQQFLGCTFPVGLERANSNESDYKVKVPSPEARKVLDHVFAPLNEQLYMLLESCPGPIMEQNPFPRFEER